MVCKHFLPWKWALLLSYLKCVRTLSVRLDWRCAQSQVLVIEPLPWRFSVTAGAPHLTLLGLQTYPGSPAPLHITNSTCSPREFWDRTIYYPCIYEKEKFTFSNGKVWYLHMGLASHLRWPGPLLCNSDTKPWLLWTSKTRSAAWGVPGPRMPGSTSQLHMLVSLNDLRQVVRHRKNYALLSKASLWSAFAIRQTSPVLFSFRS